MTHTQKKMFFNTAAAIINKKKGGGHKLTGTRLLAPHLPEIRKAVNMGLTHKEIAKALSSIPCGPFDSNKTRYALAAVTRQAYVTQICNELNLSRKVA